MNDKCFEPGIIQAFLDGEAGPELSFTITDHTAKCDKCALALAQAEEESAQVFAMLDREMNTLVPTQRLWSSISVAIAEEKKQHSLWDRLRSGILATFANPSMTVAAGVLVVFGLFAAVWTLRTPDISGDLSDMARAGGTSTIAPAAPLPAGGPHAADNPAPVLVVQSNFSDKDIAKLAKTISYKPAAERVTVTPAVDRGESYLPGEESYIRTISNLKETVESRKDAVMSPSVRISYERDMAVVNDSIKRMKDVVRRNPKNQAAKQVLYSSYQNKIDLLNSIVEREELMASMQ